MVNLSMSEKEQMVIRIKSCIFGNKVHPEIKFAKMHLLLHLCYHLIYFHDIQNPSLQSAKEIMTNVGVKQY